MCHVTLSYCEHSRIRKYTLFRCPGAKKSTKENEPKSVPLKEVGKKLSIPAEPGCSGPPLIDLRLKTMVCQGGSTRKTQSCPVNDSENEDEN